MRTATKAVLWSVLGANALAILVALYWLLVPVNVADIKTPIPILNENRTIQVGEPILMFLVVDKYQEAEPTPEAFITCDSGNLVTMQASRVTLPPGRTEVIVDWFLLPPKVLDGDTCSFTFRTEYQVNPLRTVIEESTSEKFTVKE